MCKLNDQPKEQLSAVALNLLDDLGTEGIVIDKTKFPLIFEDETPESVRLRIEPVDNSTDVRIEPIDNSMDVQI